jgi:hypothetical protein
MKDPKNHNIVFVIIIYLFIKKSWENWENKDDMQNKKVKGMNRLDSPEKKK